MARKKKMKEYTYYPGCTLKTYSRSLEGSALRLSEHLGFKLVELPRWNCCGTVASISKDNKMYYVASIRNLVRVKEQKSDEVVALCTICYNTLRRADLLYQNDSDVRDAIDHFMDEEITYGGGVRVRHYIEILRDDIGFDSIVEMAGRSLGGIKVAPYYGCLLLRPTEVAIDNPERPTVMEDILSRLGATMIDSAYKTECCGAFETVNRPDYVANRTLNIIESARQNGAEMMVTFCPLCHFNLDRRQKMLKESNPLFEPMPILYFPQLMLLAFEPLEKVVSALEGNYVDPMPLLEKYEL